MALTVRAHAKLNLTLEVLSRRDDGYHEVASVMHAISLADEIRFEEAPDLRLLCADAALATPDNLVLRAAELLRQQHKVEAGAQITLDKCIPTSSGLGGGSADAAATLAALNRLWKLKLPPHELEDMAASLGSDVPFFLGDGAGLAEGRGESVTPLPSVVGLWFLVVTPQEELPQKTATMYGYLNEKHWTTGKATEQLAARLVRHEKVREAYLFNVFDAVAPGVFSAVSWWRARLLEEKGARPHLSGAGPSLFIPVEDEPTGKRLAAVLTAEGPVACFVVSTVARPLEFVA